MLRLIPILLLAGCALASEPDATELIRRSVANDESRLDSPEARYEFTEHALTRNLDDSGRLRSTSSRTRDIKMADYQTRRDRYRKAVREIPDAFLFRLVGEERIHSRPAWIVEATPRPGYEPVDRNSKLYTKVKARIWIDKAEGRWARIEAELLDTVTFGWILVRIHKGSRVRMTQEPVNGEAWLPRELWYNVSLRIGLLSFRRMEVEAKYGDYRPLDGQPHP